MDQLKKWDLFTAETNGEHNLRLNYKSIDFIITDYQRELTHWVSSHSSESYQWSTQQAMCMRPLYQLLELVEEIGSEDCFQMLMGLKMRMEYPIHHVFSMRQMDLVVQGLGDNK